MIRYALDTGIIDESDMFMQDRPFWQKIKDNAPPELLRMTSKVGNLTMLVVDDINPTFSIKIKSRTIDPDVIVGQEILPLSMIDEEYRDILLAYRERKRGFLNIRLLE